jgi:ATP-dependent protease HslVU (ClpYQ) peptidase subunit
LTTVVAVARGGEVHMAGDTLTNVYERPVVGAARKVLRIRAGSSEVLVGVSGEGALGGLLPAHLKIDDVPPTPGVAFEWANAVAVAVSEIAEAHHCLDDGRLDATLLLGWNGLLWTVTHHQAVPHPDGVAAIGSGEGPGIGAVDAFLQVGYTPRDAVQAAVRVAISRDKHSAAPTMYEWLGPAEPAQVSPASGARRAGVARRGK